MGRLRGWLLAGLVAVGLGSVLAPGQVSLRAVLPGAAHEVTYDVDHPGVRCETWQGRERCDASWSLRLGNTGSEDQEVVIVRLGGVSDGLGPASWRVRDLRADAPRAFDPHVELQWSAATHTQTIRIHGLAAGAYLEASAPDVTHRSSDELGQLEATTHVEADGRVVAGDPQGATVASLLSDLFGAFF